MKKETPRSLKRRAGLADGLNDSGARCRSSYHGAGPKEKRSPKEQSAVPGTLIQVSQVVLDHPGRDHVTGWARSDGSAPASKIVEGDGTNPAQCAGLVVLRLRSGSLHPAMTLSTTTNLRDSYRGTT